MSNCNWCNGTYRIRCPRCRGQHYPNCPCSEQAYRTLQTRDTFLLGDSDQ